MKRTGRYILWNLWHIDNKPQKSNASEPHRRQMVKGGIDTELATMQWKHRRVAKMANKEIYASSSVLRATEHSPEQINITWVDGDFFLTLLQSLTCFWSLR